MSEPAIQRTVLIAEDDADQVEMMAEGFAAAGFKVISCNDGLAALNLFQSQRPDVVVVDIKLPIFNGLTLMESLPPPKPVLIAVSGYSDVESDAVYERSAHVFIRKPFAVADIVAAAKRHLPPNQHPQSHLLKTLSKSEYKVLSYIVDGYETEQISALMEISVETVYKHRKAIRRKCKGLSFVEISLMFKSISATA
jgi:FixJ family two-component response regulator